MTKFIRITFALPILLFAIMSIPTNAASLSESYSWHDGERIQRVWLNPDLLTEFNPSESGASAVKNASPGAAPQSTKRPQAGVRLWRINNNASNATVRALRAAHPRGAYSPVFHGSSSTSGRMRALPGNVIVFFNLQWDATTVKNWIEARKLKVVKKLEIGANVYVIKTAPGLDALDVANSLYQSGEVVSATPNWWEEMATR